MTAPALSERAVRYHWRRDEAGAMDGREAQVSKVAAASQAISHWRGQRSGGGEPLGAA